jgi:uncharacterized YigZ family protein
VNNPPTVPIGESRYEITIKHSRFLGFARSLEESGEAASIIAEFRNKYKDASHVVYGFITGGLHREMSGYSDDREPRGTAGRPILEVIKGSGTVNVIVLVIRYFGGTKLGTGGLSRAYSACAAGTLKQLKTKELVEEQKFAIEVPYESFDAVKKIITDNRGTLNKIEYATRVQINGVIPSAYLEVCNKQIGDATRGTVSIE